MLKHHQSSPASCRLYRSSSGRETPDGESGGGVNGSTGKRGNDHSYTGQALQGAGIQILCSIHEKEEAKLGVDS